MATMTTQESTFVNPPAYWGDRFPRTVQRGGNDDYVVLVNANARGFRRAWKRGWFEQIPDDKLIITHSLEDAEDAVRKIVRRGVSSVFACGGDGTVSGLVNELRALVPNADEQPSVGIIRMGTGNALAHFAGASDAATDLARLGAGADMESVNVGLIEAEGRLCPFAGCGADAGVLNDYIELKKKFLGTPLELMMSGVQGYLMSGVLRTAPKMLKPSLRRRVFAINEGPVAYAVNKRGDIVETFARGAVLYSGDALSAMVGSIPFYGYGLRMFPAATRLPDFFQVRVASMNPLSVVANIGKMWRGDLERKHGIHDFLAQKVRFEFDGEVPFHISGDAEGYRREVTFSMSPRAFDFVRPIETSADVVTHRAFNRAWA